MKLLGKVVVITGSTRGIGRAIADACSEEGARVVISSRDEAAVQRLAEEFVQRGFDASGVAADVSSQSDLEKLLDHAIETWGRVDVWINNAGLSGGYRPLQEMSPQEITDIVDVNLSGTLKACRIVIPYFIPQGGGVLIKLSGKGGRGEAAPYTTA